MQFFIHYFSHLGLPFFIAYFFFRSEWKKAYLIMLATMLVDLDHLLANPIFQENRCSVGFHYFHSIYAIVVYIGMLFLKKPYRIVGIGLVLHMITDFVDCLIMFEKCQLCYENAPAWWALDSVGKLLGW
ncbi:MAG: hypothetical protein ACI9RU_002866 [Litorivivens sp.]|jgi:hypothetical protein